MAICGISGEECPSGCWLQQQDATAKAKLLKNPRSSEAPQTINFEDKVTIARQGIHAIERYEDAMERRKDRVRKECPNCPNLNQI